MNSERPNVCNVDSTSSSEVISKYWAPTAAIGTPTTTAGSSRTSTRWSATRPFPTSVASDAGSSSEVTSIELENQRSSTSSSESPAGPTWRLESSWLMSWGNGSSRERSSRALVYA